MNQLKYILLVPICLISAMLSAQDADSTVIKRDVTIRKSYEPEIPDASKINVLPSVLEPKLEKIDVDYSKYSSLLDPPYEIKSLAAARIRIPAQPDRKDGFMRLGMGNYTSTIADVLCPILNKPTYRWDLNFNHLGTFSDKMHHENLLGMAVHRFYESGEFLIDGSYGYEGFNYYGANKLTDTASYQNDVAQFLGRDYFNDDAVIKTWNFSMGYKSIPSEDKARSYSMMFKYNAFAPNVGLNEHVFNTSFKYDSQIEENNAGVNLELQNLVYKSDAVLNAFQPNTYSIFRLNPYYDFNQDNWYLHVGAKLNFSSQGKSFVPAADIKAQATLIDKSIYLYGGIVGDLEANTMKEMLQLNKYIDLNEKVANTYTPFNMYGGLKLKLLYNFITDISFGYRKITDQYFFVNDTLHNVDANTTVLNNVFTTTYSDASVFTTNIKLDYNFNQQFGFQFAWKKSSWDVDEELAWQMPTNEFDFGIDMKLSKRTSVNIYSYFASGRKARATDGSAIDLKSIADVNMGIFYAHNSKVSAFLKMNNLIHRKYDQWYGYDVNGFNAMFGLVFAF